MKYWMDNTVLSKWAFTTWNQWWFWVWRLSFEAVLKIKKLILIILVFKANENSDLFWSNPVMRRIQTESTAPFRSPEICQDCFEIGNDGDSVYIYWKKMKRHEVNAANFCYKIYKVNTNGKIEYEFYHDFSHTKAKTKLIWRLLTTHNISSNHAKIDVHSSSSLIILLGSENSKGIAPQYSKIIVPSLIGNIIFSFVKDRGSGWSFR